MVTRHVLAVTGALAACAGAPQPCPQQAEPKRATALDVPDCVVRGFPGRVWPSVARYPATSTDSARGPDRVIVGPQTGLCAPRAIARGPRGEIYVLNYTVRVDSSRRVPDDLDPASLFDLFTGPQREGFGAPSRPSWSAWVTVYDSSAIGDTPPIRTLQFPSAGFTAPTTLAVDRDGQVYLGTTVEYDQDPGSVAVFEPDADGNVAPVRRIAGRGTGLRSPMRVAVDPDGFAYAINLYHRVDDTIRVFAPDATGDAGPCRVLAGEQTRLHRPVAIAAGRQDHLYVVVSGRAKDGRSRNAVLVYDRQASGDVPPRRAIAPLADRIFDGMYDPRHIAVGLEDSLYVRSVRSLSVFAAESADTLGPSRTFHTNAPAELFTLDRQDTLYAVSGGVVKVYPPGYAGVGHPVRTIGGSRTGLRSASGIAVDSRGWLYLAEKDAPRILAFAPGANGDVAPARAIVGWLTGLQRGAAIALDDQDRLFVINGPTQRGGGAILVFAPGAMGEDRPVRVHRGVETPMRPPSAFAFDSKGDMYLSQQSQVTVFRRQASASEPPIRTLAGPNTGLRLPSALALGVGDTLFVLNPPTRVNPCRAMFEKSTELDPADVTVYPPMASGDNAPVRRIALPGIPGFTMDFPVRQLLDVDSSGTLRVRYGRTLYTVAPGRDGRGQPIRTTVEVPPPGTEGSSAVTGDDGWVYQTNATGNRLLAC